jgi:hypothetical protein
MCAVFTMVWHVTDTEWTLLSVPRMTHIDECSLELVHIHSRSRVWKLTCLCNLINRSFQVSANFGEDKFHPIIYSVDKFLSLILKV